MAIRVTAAEVKVVVPSSILDADVLAAFITPASIITDRLASETCHDATSLKQVELYLSAHLLSLREQRTSGEKIGDAQESYARPGALLKGLDSTFYGQQAIMMDCSGKLVNIGKMPVVFDTAFEASDA